MAAEWPEKGKKVEVRIRWPTAPARSGKGMGGSSKWRWWVCTVVDTKVALVPKFQPGNLPGGLGMPPVAAAPLTRFKSKDRQYSTQHDNAPGYGGKAKFTQETFVKVRYDGIARISGATDGDEEMRDSSSTPGAGFGRDEKRWHSEPGYEWVKLASGRINTSGTRHTKLRPGQAPFGCAWFGLWAKHVHRLAHAGQRPLVVYRRGLMDAEEEGGLGFSQRREVAYLRKLMQIRKAASRATRRASVAEESREMTSSEKAAEKAEEKEVEEHWIREVDLGEFEAHNPMNKAEACLVAIEKVLGAQWARIEKCFARDSYSGFTAKDVLAFLQRLAFALYLQPGQCRAFSEEVLERDVFGFEAMNNDNDESVFDNKEDDGGQTVESWLGQFLRSEEGDLMTATQNDVRNSAKKMEAEKNQKDADQQALLNTMREQKRAQRERRSIVESNGLLGRRSSDGYTKAEQGDDWWLRQDNKRKPSVKPVPGSRVRKPSQERETRSNTKERNSLAAKKPQFSATRETNMDTRRASMNAFKAELALEEDVEVAQSPREVAPSPRDKMSEWLDVPGSHYNRIAMTDADEAEATENYKLKWCGANSVKTKEGETFVPPCNQEGSIGWHYNKLRLEKRQAWQQHMGSLKFKTGQLKRRASTATETIKELKVRREVRRASTVALEPGASPVSPSARGLEQGGAEVTQGGGEVTQAQADSALSCGRSSPDRGLSLVEEGPQSEQSHTRSLADSSEEEAPADVLDFMAAAHDKNSSEKHHLANVKRLSSLALDDGVNHTVDGVDHNVSLNRSESVGFTRAGIDSRESQASEAMQGRLLRHAESAPSGRASPQDSDPSVSDEETPRSLRSLMEGESEDGTPRPVVVDRSWRRLWYEFLRPVLSGASTDADEDDDQHSPASYSRSMAGNQNMPGEGTQGSVWGASASSSSPQPSRSRAKSPVNSAPPVFALVQLVREQHEGATRAGKGPVFRLSHPSLQELLCAAYLVEPILQAHHSASVHGIPEGGSRGTQWCEEFMAKNGLGDSGDSGSTAGPIGGRPSNAPSQGPIEAILSADRFAGIMASATDMLAHSPHAAATFARVFFPVTSATSAAEADEEKTLVVEDVVEAQEAKEARPYNVRVCAHMNTASAVSTFFSLFSCLGMGARAARKEQRAAIVGTHGHEVNKADYQPLQLDLSNSGLNTDSLRAWVNSNRQMGRTRDALAALCASQNELGPAAAAFLCKAIRFHKGSLRRLDLSGNPIGDIGAKALAKSLRHDLLGLVELDCSGCFRGTIGGDGQTAGFAGTGAQRILTAVERHSTVSVLRLSGNLLVDEGAMQNHAKLRSLSITGQSAASPTRSNQGAVARTLVRMLSANTVLTSLDISGWSPAAHMVIAPPTIDSNRLIQILQTNNPLTPTTTTTTTTTNQSLTAVSPSPSPSKSSGHNMGMGQSRTRLRMMSMPTMKLAHMVKAAGIKPLPKLPKVIDSPNSDADHNNNHQFDPTDSPQKGPGDQKGLRRMQTTVNDIEADNGVGYGGLDEEGTSQPTRYYTLYTVHCTLYMTRRVRHSLLATIHCTLYTAHYT
jgi:hypothetical protein